MRVSSFDIDGVINMGPDLPGLKPQPFDVIITGRSYEEGPETFRLLESKNIVSRVFMNKVKFDDKTRESSGEHKANTINELIESGLDIVCHYEDDPVQAAIIEEKTPVPVFLVTPVKGEPIVELENVRHDDI